MRQDRSTVPVFHRFPSIVFLVLLAILQFLIISVAFLGGYLFYEWRYSEGSPNNRFALLNEAYKLLQENAYFALPEQKSLEYGMIRGMLQTYNEPFTVFVEPPQHKLQTQQLQGKYGGIGVRIERDGENNVFLYPLPNSTALKAGVRDGDRLFRVGSLEITATIKNDELQSAIRGPIGEKVTITIGHSPDYLPAEVSIERAEVALPSVTYNLTPQDRQVGIIHIQLIAETTPKEVTRAIQELQGQGAVRFIIDVRNNGGGLVEAGVNTARLFLKSGTVIEEQYRGQPVKNYAVTRPGPFADLPMVVLVNKGTASAAEIFAGAIQGQKRASIVGTPTYGKDTIQLVFSLSDGSSLHVTAAHWWVPGLADKISGKGLQPDIPIAENDNESQGVQAAIDAGQK